MGLFTKKKKSNVFDPREQYVPEVVYNEDLTTTLVKTIGIGSRDAKKVVVEHESDTLSYYFDSGVLRGVESDKSSLELYQRFYWIDKKRFDEESLESIAQLADEQNLLDFYQTLRESYPEYVDLMTPILYSNSLQLLLSHYGEKIKSVTMELMEDEDDRKVRALSLMNVDSRSIRIEVEKEVEKQSNLVKSITSSEIDITVLKVVDQSYVPSSDLQKIVWAAAESESSLEMVSQLSKGFVWSEILETVNELAYSRKIEIADPNSIIEESEPLPDLDLLLDEPEGNQAEESVSEDQLPDPDVEEDSVEPLNNDPFGDPEEWEYSTPAQDTQKDDGGFVYEEASAEDDNTLMKYLLDDFEFNVKVALAEEEFDRDSIVEISSLLRNNRELEEKTTEVEIKISPLQTNYDNRFADFQYLSVGKTIEAENIVGDDVDKMRELSNRSFRELYDLEEERFEIGVERKKVLGDLEKKLVDLTNENSQELLYRLNQKRDAIDNTVNLAYHTPGDDEHLEIDPTFLAAVDDPTPEDTPMFQQLMKKYGDPFKTLTK